MNFNFRIHFYQLIESLIRWIGGGIGQKIRAFYYKKRCASWGNNVKIDVGVILENPNNIFFGNDVWVMPYTIITSRPTWETFQKRTVINKSNLIGDGKIYIGNNVSIGLFNIINGYGGIVIGNNVTTSARVSLYSFSHAPYDPKNRRVKTFTNSMNDSTTTVCVSSPIHIKEGAWLGLGVSVFGGTIGEFSFIKTGSIILKDVDDNKMIAIYPKDSLVNRYE